MTGITTGSRQFNFMLPLCQLTWDTATEVLTADNGYVVLDAGSTNRLVYQTTKLDLRALLDGGAKGLDFLNISLQESIPWTAHKESAATPYVMDVITTVRPSTEMLQTWLVLPPGFRGGLVGAPTDPVERNWLNPSQVIWGLWRYFVLNQQMPNDKSCLELIASSSFGDGEVAVAPNCYHTRIVSYTGWNNAPPTHIPALNLVCSAQVVDMNEGQEFTQMIRGSQR